MRAAGDGIVFGIPQWDPFVPHCRRLFAVSPEQCHAASAGSLLTITPEPVVCTLTPFWRLTAVNVEGHANKPRAHTLNLVMSCVSLLTCVFELAPDMFVLGLAVVWLIDVSTKEWLRSDGQALAREERSWHMLYLQPSGPEPALHHGPVQYGSMFSQGGMKTVQGNSFNNWFLCFPIQFEIANYARWGADYLWFLFLNTPRENFILSLPFFRFIKV